MGKSATCRGQFTFAIRITETNSETEEDGKGNERREVNILCRRVDIELSPVIDDMDRYSTGSDVGLVELPVFL